MLVPLAPRTKLLNTVVIRTASVLDDVCGTTKPTKGSKPFILLYPPSMSGSKLVNSKACPGFIMNVDWLRTNPPSQTNGNAAVSLKSANYTALM